MELRWRAVPRFPTVVNRYVQPLQYELRLDGEFVGESTVELNYLPATRRVLLRGARTLARPRFSLPGSLSGRCVLFQDCRELNFRIEPDAGWLT